VPSPSFSPLPWERICWTAHPWPRRHTVRYVLTDLRLVISRSDGVDEVLVDQIEGLTVRAGAIERLLRRRTIEVARGGPRLEPPLKLAGLSRQQALALVQQLVGRGAADLDIDASLVEEAVRAATPVRPGAVAAGTLAALAVLTLAIQLRGSETAITYPTHDAIYQPNGVKRDAAEITRFMEREVMPWARRALAPVVGGADRVTCATCHGSDGEARGWAMPAVADLPYPKVRAGGLDGAERYAWQSADPQLRNAVYADLAQDDRQATAAYMRQVVMPDMARLLGRPAYDFARPYESNRTRFAFGCYHCHRVK
jgi:hypothetical protein